MTGLPVRPVPFRAPLCTVLIALTLGCHHSVQSQGKPTRAEAQRAAPELILGPLSGQSVPLMPSTYLIAGDSIPGLPADHLRQLAWADSVIAAQFVMRGPEVTWIVPSELRKLALRGAGIVKDPDKMGQAVMRAQGLKATPDQFLTNLRPLMAMANARYVMVPAALAFVKTPNGVEVAATLVVIDSRTGAILWHSEPSATGATAAAALTAIFPRILP